MYSAIKRWNVFLIYHLFHAQVENIALAVRLQRQKELLNQKRMLSMKSRIMSKHTDGTPCGSSQPSRLSNGSLVCDVNCLINHLFNSFAFYTYF